MVNTEVYRAASCTKCGEIKLHATAKPRRAMLRLSRFTILFNT